LITVCLSLYNSLTLAFGIKDKVHQTTHVADMRAPSPLRLATNHVCAHLSHARYSQGGVPAGNLMYTSPCTQ
jgi:hypothetical protein